MHNPIDWDENGQPVSRYFDDIYFSKADGLQESRYVFQQHNQLGQRFGKLKSGEHFVIGETGFGTGLNFLACWQLWQQCAPITASLHYLSVEKYPLLPEQLKRALQLWPELQLYSQRLLNWYERSLCQRDDASTVFFNSQNVYLTLILDDATTGLQQYPGDPYPRQHLLPACPIYWRGVDTWFLDGFAPAKNPDMWSLSLLETIAALSHPGSTFATFTAAGQVKRHLQTCGFDVNKTAGFGHKRDMLWGEFKPTTNNTVHREPSPLHWTQVRDYQPLKKTSRIAVIGAGLAGCHSAHALAQKGFKVTLIDRHSDLAREGSGNPQGILYAKLSADNGKLSEFNLAALLTAQETYREFWQQCPSAGQNNGVLQLGHNAKAETLHKQIVETFAASTFVNWLDRHQASEKAGLELKHSALYFPFCGWLNPVTLCQWLSQHSNIQLLTATTVHQLDFLSATDQWQLNGQQQLHDWQDCFDGVVIANARDAQQFYQSQWLPTKTIRGQITYIAEHAGLKPLSTSLCAQGYIAPLTRTENGIDFHTIGASFNLNDVSTEISKEDHQTNLAHLHQVLPQVTNPKILGGRVGFRCTSPDYLPIAGPLPDVDAFHHDFAAFAHNARQMINQQGQYHRNLYLNVAHGSKGLNYTPLSAAIIAHRIAGEPPPCSQALADALNPARFIIRRIMRTKN